MTIADLVQWFAQRDKRGPLLLELKHKIWRLRDWAWRGSLCPICGSREIARVRMCSRVSRSGAGGIFPRCKACGWDSDRREESRSLRRTLIQRAVYRLLMGMCYPGNKGLPGLRGFEFEHIHEVKTEPIKIEGVKIEPMRLP